jgi:DNA-directed RNA polymerase subunit omega
MAQEGFDKLMALTDSRYRLSMIVARRAAQLKAGIPPVLNSDQYPKTRNTVTVAMKELTDSRAVRWGDELPSTDELRQLVERERREEQAAYTVSRQAARDEDDFDED